MYRFNVKSQFAFDGSQRVGILLLLSLMIGTSYVYFFVSFTSEVSTFDITSEEVIALQKTVDSLREVEIENRKPKRYPFNPNFITDYKAYTLGMTPEEYDRWSAFRAKDQWINSVADFKRVTQISDSLLDVISPYFKFPDWVNRSSRKRIDKKAVIVEKSYSAKIDLNKATLEELQEVRGIGPALSKRIVDRREQLGGFSNDLQLRDIWGLKSEVITQILFQFTVKTPKPIVKMNVNTATASDFDTIPGVSFELGKAIWEFIKLREGISDLNELLKIEMLSSRKLELIQLYLFIETE